MDWIGLGGFVVIPQCGRIALSTYMSFRRFWEAIYWVEVKESLARFGKKNGDIPNMQS